MSLNARIAASLIALLAWLGLIVQLFATRAEGYPLSSSLLILLAYFTITTNLLVALVFTAVAAGWRLRWLPSTLAGVSLCILMVGIIFALLLSDLRELSGGSLIANTLLHQVTPLLVPLFWLAFAPKGLLRRRDPLLWSAYPLLYLVYALLRGSVTDIYAYPFLDVTQLGWSHVLINAALIAVVFLLVGFGFTQLDAWLSRRASSGYTPDIT